MAVTKEALEAALGAKLPLAHLEVVDTSGGCGAMFECVIVSEAFQGKPLIQRHRLVNEALAAELKQIHAFSMKTYTPADWEKQKAKTTA